MFKSVFAVDFNRRWNVENHCTNNERNTGGTIIDRLCLVSFVILRRQQKSRKCRAISTLNEEETWARVAQCTRTDGGLRLANNVEEEEDKNETRERENIRRQRVSRVSRCRVVTLLRRAASSSSNSRAQLPPPRALTAWIYLVSTTRKKISSFHSLGSFISCTRRCCMYIPLRAWLRRFKVLKNWTEDCCCCLVVQIQ